MQPSSNHNLRSLVASVEILSHESVLKKIELLLLKAMNQLTLRRNPEFAPWIVVAVNELVFVGVLHLSEVPSLIMQKRLQHLLNVFFRPLEVETWEAEDSEYDATEKDNDVQLVDLEDWFQVDLTGSTDGDELSQMARAGSGSSVKRRYEQDQNQGTFKLQRFSTPYKENHNANPYFDESMETSENRCNFKDSTSVIVEQPFQIQRMGIFCPRVFRQRFLGAIMSAMDNMPHWQPVPQFKRTGYKLDTIWFVPVDAYSTNWLVSIVENISKKPRWHRAGIFIEPWSMQFVMRNVIRFTLPWKPGGPGNGKGRVVQRLRKANRRHESHRWNQIGCRVVGRRIYVFMAVNDYALRSLARGNFSVFYGFSRYRCQVMDTVLR